MPLSPEQIAKFRAILDEPTPTPSNSTKTRKEIRHEFEKRFGATTPTADLVAKIQAAAAVVWLPHSYVLFARASTCKACGATERVLDIPKLFLQQRKERRDDSNPYLYTPVKEIEFVGLPRRIILNVVTTPFCLSCFESAPCEKPSSLNQVDTGLLRESLGIMPASLTEASTSQEASLPSQEPPAPRQTSSPEVSVGFTSETEFGVGSDELSNGLSVGVDG